ncbi:hypothetical protein WJX72_002706 [[Myrmecia] bisecta]|uniref:Endonuclease n=1 Tax=[Myrmecia] bisecta TaxID=41462 RepID=A0AAW1Q0K8_9CHLO
MMGRLVNSHPFKALLAGATLGGAGTWLLLKQIRPPEPEQDPRLKHKALKYGLPSTENLRFYKNFVVSFDCRLRNPHWVLEHVHTGSHKGDANRKNVEFFEDEGLEEQFRNRLTDFKASGYDRGHLVPAANHKESKEALLETFTLSNVSPQVGKGFNRDYWARFERFVKQLTRDCDDVYIVTGPLYLPKKSGRGYVMQHPMIGEAPRLVAVPTHFYKVVLAECRPRVPFLGSSSGHVVGAFVMPNEAIDPDTPLTAFAVPISSLEEVTGVRFFPAHLNDDRRRALDSTALSWQRTGRQELRQLQAEKQGQDHLLLVEPASGPTEPQSSQGIGQELALESPPRRLGRSRSRRSSKHPQPEPAVQSEEVKLVTGPEGQGSVHICEHTVCKLPAVDWYLAKQRALKAAQGQQLIVSSED